MDESESVMIEGEDYEVVDECTGEDDTTSQDQSVTKEETDSQNMDAEKSETENAPIDNVAEQTETNTSSVEEITEKIDNTEENIDNTEENIDNIEENIDTEENIDNTEEKEVKQNTVDIAQGETDTIDANDENTVDEKVLDESDVVSEIEPCAEKNTEEECAENIQIIVIPESTKQCNKENNSMVPVETGIDFTVDDNVDNLADNQKEITNDVIMQQSEEIKNMNIGSNNIEKQNKEDENKNQSTEQRTDAIECITLKDDEDQDVIDVTSQSTVETEGKANWWYEEKLAAKEGTIKERLSKLARVLELSYPAYNKWLNLTEKLYETPVCKLEPPIRCPLNRPYTNRWKFVCNRRSIQESQKETDAADASANKNTERVWHLELTEAWGVKVSVNTDFSSFVFRAVKVFEDFLQTTEEMQEQSPENFSDDISIEMEQKKESSQMKQEWLWLLVRCNSKDELMLFATGKNIKRSTMDRLKQVFESGPGKDCNVKSLYCKSVNKCNDITTTNTTFLVGSEALDEVVGGIKIQLAPKTNFWSNAAGAENIANTVARLLEPSNATTVLEIGCGIGLIGLKMASKCQQVIGVDSQSEVEEAEMTCEMNNIKNASFIVGSPSEVIQKINATVKNNKTYAIINANTAIGRSLEVMTCIRKLTAIERLVMVTTLTRQSVRAILELACPGNSKIGSPFMPVRACLVDTLPVGPHFELVILMQRRPLNQVMTYLQKMLNNKMNATKGETTEPKETVQNLNKTVQNLNKTVQNLNKTAQNLNKTSPPQLQVKNKPTRRKTLSQKKGKSPVVAKNLQQTRFVENIMSKAKFKGKRPYSPEKIEGPPKKFPKKQDKFKAPRPAEHLMKMKERIDDRPQLRINPMFEKVRDNKDQSDLRERLTSTRIGTEIIQQVKEHQAILEIAKEKLSGPAPTVDINTAKQLQSMLNLVLEQTNKLQNQLPPRSVWDRIAPPENMKPSLSKETQDDTLLKGRFIQETGNQDIVITAPNQNFIESGDKPPFKKYHNLPPLEPNLIAPVTIAVNTSPERFHTSEFHKPHPGNVWNRDKMDRSRWNDSNNQRKPSPPPIREHVSPLLRHRLSPKRPQASPPRRHMSPVRRPVSPYRSRSPMRRQFSPQRRPASPMRRPMSPPGQQHGIIFPQRRQTSPVNRMMSSSARDMYTRRQMMSQEPGPSMRRGGSPFRGQEQRPVSPPRRQPSPPKRQSPPRQLADEWDIPSRGAFEKSNWCRENERPMEVWRNERPSNNMQQRMKDMFMSKSVNKDNWDITESSQDGKWVGGGSGESWNNKQLPGKFNQKESRPQNSDNRWQAPGQNPGPSGDHWSIRGKESFSNREENWSDNSRWESSTFENRNQGDKDDWNDLPEDARDPWGDDSTANMKERWQKDAPNSSSNWNREGDRNNSWQGKGNSWQNKSDSWKNKNEPWNKDDSWKNNEDAWQNRLETWQRKMEMLTKGNSWQNKNEPWTNKGETWQNKEDSWQNKPHSSWQNKEEQWDKGGDSWKNKGGPQSLASKAQWSNSNNQNAASTSSRWPSQCDTGNVPLLPWQGGGTWKPQNFNSSSQRSIHSAQFKDRR